MKNKKLTKAKAKEILHDGTAHGKKLTDKQRRFFGAISNAESGLTVINDNDGQYAHPGKVTKINSNRITMKNVPYPVLGISNSGHKQMMYPNGEYLFNGTNVTEYPIMKNGGIGFIANQITNIPPFTEAKSGIHIKKSHKGLLHKNLGVPAGEKIPASKLKIKSTDSAAVKKRKIFAQNAKKWKHQDGGSVIPIGNDPNVRKYIDAELQQNYPGIPLEVLDRMNKPAVPGIEDTPAMSAIRKGYAPLTSQPVNTTPPVKLIAGTHEYNVQQNKKKKDPVLVARYQKGGKMKKAQFGEDILNPNGTKVNLNPLENNNTAFDVITGQVNPNITNAVDRVGMFDKLGKKIGQVDNNLSPIGGITGALNTGVDLMQGFSMLKDEKNQRKNAEQFAALSGLVQQASSIRPEKPKRKYVRPEDQVIDPEILSNSYGNGTNFLSAEYGESIKKAQFGQQAGSWGNVLGSKIFGGTGEVSGTGKIGSTAGSTIGNILLPGLGGTIGGFIGGGIGGAIGANKQKETQNFQDQAYSNLQKAAFEGGIQNIQNQYSSFMENGGKMQMGGELQTLWGGEAEQVSQNPYLPDNGESILFKGQSHDNGGIGVKFGNSPVEVEGGEPAVKLQSGGTGDNDLVIFGDMKIPSYGVTEINDPKAKGKKFKNYINDLNKIESKQNKIVDKSFDLIDDANPKDTFDKLKMSSGEAMLIGANMNLKEIARKKQMASIVQNAILETAKEHGLKSDALAEGKFKKDKSSKTAKNGMSLESYQLGGNKKYINENEIQNYINAGYKANPTDPNELILEAIPEKTIKGKKGEKYIPNENAWWKSLTPEQKAAHNARKREEIKKDPRYKDVPDQIIPGTPEDRVYLQPTVSTPTDLDRPFGNALSQGQEYEEVQPNVRGLGIGSVLSSYFPYIRPTNKLRLDPNQLAGEMYALSNNQLEPVQAQLYNPLLQQVTDLSYQDQLNANQADFNTISRQVGNNPSAQAALAAQKYAANTSILGEQFRQNQTNRLNTYNANRNTLNDATLKNLGILDQQYTRQAQAKSNTKAVAQAALSSIADKIGQNKRDQMILNIDQQRYNYRFGPNGMAWNLNGPAYFNTQGMNLPTIDNQGREVTTEEILKFDKNNNPAGKSLKKKVKEDFNKNNPKTKNGGLVKSYKYF